MKKVIILIAITAIHKFSFSQEKKELFDLIHKNDLKYNIEVLCSDSLEGRLTATIGQKKAANFIAKCFSDIGVTHLFNSYLDTFSLHEYSWGEIYIRTGKYIFSNQDEISYQGFYNQSTEKEVELVFAGYGTNNELNQIKVKDRMVLIFSNNMRAAYGTINKINELGAYGVIIANPNNEKQFNAIKNSRGNYLLKKRLSSSKINIPHNMFQHFVISNKQIKSLTGKSIRSFNKLIRQNKINTYPLTTIYVKSEKVHKTVKTENVVGFINGKSDKNIVLSAHYDHLGKIGNHYYPGADDNASGVAAVISIAKVLKKADTLNYNIIFLLTTGEEVGFLGAKHFINNHMYDSTNVFLNINVDMIGRSEEINENELYVSGITEYSPIKKVLDDTDSSFTKSKLNYKYNKNLHSSLYRNSDQYIFYENNIPAIIFNSGKHCDYHKITDLPININYDALKKRIELITDFILNLNNLEI